MWSEAEAKKKLCPFVNRAEEINGVMTVRQPSLCMASECMAWRWELTKQPLEKHVRPGLAYGLAVALQPTTYERGYCGAAGQSSGRPA